MSDIKERARLNAQETVRLTEEAIRLAERLAVATHIQATMEGVKWADHGPASIGIVEALGVLAVEVMAGKHVAD